MFNIFYSTSQMAVSSALRGPTGQNGGSPQGVSQGGCDSCKCMGYSMLGARNAVGVTLFCDTLKGLQIGFYYSYNQYLLLTVTDSETSLKTPDLDL